MYRVSRILLILFVGLFAGQSFADDNASGLRFYQSKILPLLRQHCLDCHSHEAGKARGGLVLDSAASMRTGGETGPAIEPGDPDASLLIHAVRYQDSALEMPPSGRLSESEIELLVQWVRDGAPAPAASGANDTPTEDRPADKSHWAFQPLHDTKLPTWVSEGSDAIDFLVDQPRTSAGLTPVDRADRRTVILRLYSDLIGLPPTSRELTQWIENESIPLSRLCEALLSRVEFGERWGRHWLDVARYADSNGCSIESNNTYDNAWRYRDYVIASLNQDKPYDRFVVEQIAGDLLDHVSTTQRCEQLIATGFLLLGPKAFGTGSFEQLRLDVIDEQIDTVGKAMLGMSLGCARCHDHKFDPVSSEDYYALAGIFSSTSSVKRKKGWRQGKTWNRVELPVLEEEAKFALEQAYAQRKEAAESGKLRDEAEKRLKKAERVMSRVRSQTIDRRAIAAAERELAIAEREMTNASNMAKVLPVVSPVPAAMAVVDQDQPVNEPIRIRGEAETLGEVVNRRIPGFHQGADQDRFSVPSNQSGRMQLAQWLVDADHGAGELLARVAVNRIWGHLLSRPLVESADNFGVTGQPASNAALLDYLAQRLIDSGWSTKSLIRDIVDSETYRLSSKADPHNETIDPDNILLWRYQPKRIDVEVLRDSMLAISGQLDHRRGGKTLQHLGLVSLGGDHLVLDAPSPYRRRSIYIPIYRDTIGLTPAVDASMNMLATFDFADPNLMLGSRSQTVVPAQSLFLMNASFVHEQADCLAENVLADASLADDQARVNYLYTTIFGRPAGPAEVRLATEYLAHFADSCQEETDSSVDDPSRRSQSTASGPDASNAVIENSHVRLDAWSSLCQAMFGSNEFLFLD